uniref:RNA-directed RNA polymerase n=1 Tax=Erysiphales associated totivirus 2 TaxID=2719849 RepID=A0A6G9ELH3_9VIRU|nr:RNA-dependent RNA polymerase [Erysiphales associated totivirus 2]
MTLSEESEADYVLVEIRRNVVESGHTYLRMGDSTLRCVARPMARLHVTAYYMHVDTPLNFLKEEALLRISKIEYGPELFPYGFASQEAIMLDVFGPIRKRQVSRQVGGLAERWYNQQDVLPYLRASNVHMRHVSCHELQVRPWEYWLGKAKPAIHMMEEMYRKHDIKPHESLFVGLLVWLASIDDKLRTWIWGHKVWEVHVDYIKWAAYIKRNVSIKLKALQNNIDVDLTQAFEMEVLLNRGLGNVDWEAERNNRVEPVLATPDQEDLREVLTELFTDLRGMGAKPKRSKFSSYWKNRWAWAPTGAYHSQHKEDAAFQGTTRETKNKFQAFCKMNTQYGERFLKRKPEIAAWPSTKYEWGKQRAIYGADITSYSVTGYGMLGCEEVLKPMFPIGDQAEATVVKQRVKEVLKSGIPYCFDYEDFNSQHSNESMKLVLEVYQQIFNNDLHEDQLDAITWTMESIDNTYVMKNSERWYKTEGTLMSGWRLTTFINTVLNYAYIRVAAGNTIPATIHNGDDVLMAVTKYSQIQRLHRNIKKIGVRYQKTKCSLAGIAEFLRVDHSKGIGTQYLARSIATLVHGQIDSEQPTNTAEMLNAFNTRQKEAISRGADAKLITDIAKKQEANLIKQGRVVTEGPSYYDVHVTKGGPIREYDPEALGCRASLFTVGGESDSPEVTLEEKISSGAYDYAEYISRNYDLQDHVEEIARRAQKALNVCAKADVVGVRITKENITASDLQKASQHKMFGKETTGMKVNLAKAFGIPMYLGKGRDAFARMVVMRSEDPIAALRLWF